ncbi:aldehyde ferredoxin oxidoreductase N-terminal domain-containing protein [Chloroflexota bacterium]
MHGYTDSILLYDLSCNETSRLPTSDYTESFLGGRGLATRLYWQLSHPEMPVFGPDNPLIIATGPLAGFTGLAGSRWQICAKSPSVTPESFSYSNFGGSWGAHLKFAGFDALVIKGILKKPGYIFIHDGICELRDARHIWGKGAAQTRAILKSELGEATRVLAIGPAGENLVSFASLLADDDASGSSGIGAVMGSKNLKAIAVIGKTRPEAAKPAKLRELTNFLRNTRKGRVQQIPAAPGGMAIKRQACFGCIAGCMRSLMKTASGKRGKNLCGAGIFYESMVRDYYGTSNEVTFLATRLCDDYGVDTNAIEAMVLWLSRCYKTGVLTDEQSGLLLSKIGSLEFIEDLVKKVSLREGIGNTLARGTLRAATEISPDTERLLGDHLFSDSTGYGYGPRMYITNSIFFAMEPRQNFPQTGEVGGTVWRWLDWLNGAKKPTVSGDDLAFISEHFWGSKVAADFSTHQGKALAAKMIQELYYVRESSILCSFSWHISAIEIFRPEIIAEILSAVTGKEYDSTSLYQLGERIFNLQHAIIVRERHCGREGDALPEFWYTTPVSESFMNPELIVPGSDGKPVNKKGTVVNKRQFEALKDEYYHLRGWDTETGLQREPILNKLGLKDVAYELKKENLTRS